LTFAEDTRLAEAKAMPILDIWDRLGRPTNLKPAGREMVGPCPVCAGRDRFGINPDQGVFICRKCPAETGRGDGIKLVQLVMGCDFPSALAFLCGERTLGLSVEEATRRRRKAEEVEAARKAASERFRAQAIEDARRIWDRARPAAGTMVADYLALRRCLPAEMPSCLRFDPAAEYFRAGKVHHVGPAMVAAVMSANNTLTAVHRTWLDLVRPKGKARILDAESGEEMPAKLVRGRKAGGAIRLVSSAAMRSRGGGALVIGEGIETVLTAAARQLPEPGASWWSVVDLGHMAGRMERRPGVKWSGVPDMADEDCFRCPKAVDALWIILDGDSDGLQTRRQVETCGKRQRARIPGLDVRVVNPGKGRDLNDLAMEGAE